MQCTEWAIFYWHRKYINTVGWKNNSSRLLGKWKEGEDHLLRRDDSLSEEDRSSDSASSSSSSSSGTGGSIQFLWWSRRVFLSLAMVLVLSLLIRGERSWDKVYTIIEKVGLSEASNDQHCVRRMYNSSGQTSGWASLVDLSCFICFLTSLSFKEEKGSEARENISQHVIANEYTSLFSVKTCPSRTSNDCHRHRLMGGIFFPWNLRYLMVVNAKSPTRTLKQSSRKQFLAAKLRWNTPCSIKYCMPQAMSWVNLIISL